MVCVHVSLFVGPCMLVFKHVSNLAKYSPGELIFKALSVHVGTPKPKPQAPSLTPQAPSFKLQAPSPKPQSPNKRLEPVLQRDGVGELLGLTTNESVGAVGAKFRH